MDQHYIIKAMFFSMKITKMISYFSKISIKEREKQINVVLLFHSCE